MAEEKDHVEKRRKRRKVMKGGRGDTQENELSDGQKCQALRPD